LSETDVLKKKEEEKINDLLFDLVKGKYGRELERANKLDDEARQLIGSVLIVVGFLLGAGAINLLSIHSWSSSLYFTGIAVLLVSIVLDYKAISKPKENYDPFQVQDILYEKVP
jgi:uncharacterized membrane protein